MTLTYSSIFAFLNAYCSPFPVFLKPPVGGEPGARSLPSLLAALIRAQARKAQGPIVFLRILFFFFFFDYPGIFGGQSYSATNWQQEVCHFQNALNSASYFYPICFKLHQNTVKTRPM